MATTAPAFQDEVVHTRGIMGTVIATYTKDGIAYLDVRSHDQDRIIYKTPASGWTVVRTQEEIEGTTDA